MSDDNGKARKPTRKKGRGTKRYRHGRPTIGVLAGWQVYSAAMHAYLEPLLAGIRAAMQEMECNLLLGCGIGPTTGEGALPAWPEVSSESQFLPLGPRNTDGLLIITPLRSESRSNAARQFIEDGHPVIFIGPGEGGPAISQDNEQGIRMAMAHLVEHGHKRIVFVAGHDDLRLGGPDKLDAYVASLEEHDLTADPDLIIRGYHTVEGGYSSMRKLLKTGTSFTAVLASNDESAIGAMRALKEAGTQIPGDVAIVGFDDRLEAWTHDPPLTSVHVPGFELGYRAAKAILDRIEGKTEKSDDVVKIPMRLTIRASCGCTSAPIPLTLTKVGKKTSSADLDRVRRQLVEAMVESFGVEQALGIDRARPLCERLVETFAASLEQGDGESFTRTVSKALDATETAGGKSYVWQTAISVLEHGLPTLLKGRRRVKTVMDAETLLHRARVMISQDAWLQHNRYIVDQRQTADHLSVLSLRMHATTSDEQMFEELAELLPRLGIRHVAVALFEEDGKEPQGFSTLRQAPDSKGKTVRFATWEFPPKALYRNSEPFNLALIPLGLHEDITGFVALDALTLESCGLVIHQIRAEWERRRTNEELERQATISNRRAGQLQTAAEIAGEVSAILDPRQLLRETVRLVSERFNFYHAAIFLVDEQGEYAVLQDASSEGGQRMLAQHHRLALGETSIVGYVASTGTARIALDVGADAVFFENPNLPDTHSEMALPLTFHGNTIGVLDIQSREPNAFTEEDVAILQVAASQLAANIENARLVQRTEAQLREMRRLYGEQVTAAWAELAAPGRRLSYVYDRVDVTPADATPPQAFDRAVEQGTTVSVVEPETQGTVLATPLKVRGQVIGVLGLEQADGSREWSHEEIALIEAVSDQVAVAIDSARLFGEARIRAEEMIVLNELAQALAASLSMETILDEAYRGVSRLLRTPNFSVGIYDAERSMIDIVHDVSELEENGRITAIPVDQGLEGYVVRHRTSVLIGEDLIGQMERMGIEPVGPQALSWLGVPLLTGDQVLGVMTIQSHTRTNAYDEHDRRLLIAIASQTAIAIQNIRLFDQVRRRAQQEHRIYEITARLRRSPDIATILQTAVNELGQALHTDRAMVRLAVKSKETETSGT